MWAAPAHRDELLQTWQALGERLGHGGDDWRTEGQRLIRSWSRWPRRYHNTSHLFACLRHLDSVRAALTDPEAAELALWFHDAVYWPWLARNEEKSADWAVSFMGRMDLDRTRREQVWQHILDTRHQAEPQAGDARWIVDIDLAILGQPEAVYRQFERHVRSEYRWVRWPRYVEGRTAVLQSFLDRPRIYGTPYFFDRYESAARHNLSSALHALSAGRLYA
ncbi:MAG: hypothetical protein JWQ72_3521 [Polaromonas sp.]|nr:hypothetical protein [Polaromonas sp.]